MGDLRQLATEAQHPWLAIHGKPPTAQWNPWLAIYGKPQATGNRGRAFMAGHPWEATHGSAASMAGHPWEAIGNWQQRPSSRGVMHDGSTPRLFSLLAGIWSAFEIKAPTLVRRRRLWYSEGGKMSGTQVVPNSEGLLLQARTCHLSDVLPAVRCACLLLPDAERWASWAARSHAAR
eukprot:1158633-Pelagomonas_calceolata.AAC.3